MSAANARNIRFVFKRFATDTGAATAIEYAMIAAGVGAAIAATVYSLGTTIQTVLYNKINNAISP